jgi:hypothetical protein
MEVIWGRAASETGQAELCARSAQHDKRKCQADVAAKHGAIASAAERRQARGIFETWNQLDRIPDLGVRRSSAPSRWTAAIFEHQ